MMKADYVFALAIAFMVGCSLYFGPRIQSNRLAMQWGLDGKPTWYAPKVLGVWGLIVFAFAVRLLIWACMTFVPERVHGAEIGLLGASIVIAGCHLYMLLMATKSN